MRNRLISLFLLLVITGCSDSSSPTVDAVVASPPSTPWLVDEMPVGAIAVAQAKRTVRDGEQVVVRGRIGGRGDPMSSDRAVFVMMDPALPSCLDRGDNCKKPWDYCCETPQSITANSATVQLMGTEPSPMAIDLTAHGFKPLDEVVVVGTVAPRPNEAVLIINATKIHRVRG